MGGCFSRGSSGPSGYKSKFQRDALKAHNKYRSMHGAPNIKLNGNISKYAQEWANKLAKEGQLQHRSEHKYGENIYYGADSRGLDEITGDKAVKTFYDEINRYNFNSDGFSSGTGHFTQVVWKGSRRLGIGVAINPRKQNEVFAVFNYDPPGNMGGKYKENVFPAKHR